MSLTLEGVLGNGVKANKYGQLEANVVAVTGGNFHSGLGFAFMVTTGLIASVTTTEGDMLILENRDNTRELHVEKVIVSANTNGTIMKLSKNGTSLSTATLGDETAVTQTNLNFNSTNDPSILCYKWDGVTSTTGITGVSGDTLLNTYILGVGVTDLPIDGSIRMRIGQNLIIAADSPSSTVQFSALIRYYFTDI